MKPYAATRPRGAEAAGVFESEDDGATWQPTLLAADDGRGVALATTLPVLIKAADATASQPDIAARRRDTELYFITGADALAQILSWKEAEEALRMARFVGAGVGTVAAGAAVGQDPLSISP